jgi:hypothetical protein
MKSRVRTVIRSLSLVSLVAVLAAVGCNRDRTERANDAEDRSGAGVDSTGITSLTGASWVSNDNAIDRIVASRCTREMTCTNVGPDKHFTTSDSCVFEVRKRTTDDLKLSQCPDGISGSGLDRCLDAIRGESCSNPLETVGRLIACRTSDMCLRSESPHR